MKEFTPKFVFLDVDCPCYNGEWLSCNITGTKCPTQWYGDDSNDWKDTTEFPKDCPAREGIIVKLDNSQK